MNKRADVLPPWIGVYGFPDPVVSNTDYYDSFAILRDPVFQRVENSNIDKIMLCQLAHQPDKKFAMFRCSQQARYVFEKKKRWLQFNYSTGVNL